MRDLSFLQLNLIKQIKNLFKSKSFSSFEYSRLGYFYLCPFFITKGYSRIFFFFDKIKSLKIYFIASCKDLINLITFKEFKTINPKKINNYKSIIVNWARLNDFKSNGQFYDKYFNVSSNKCTNILWYLIYLDNILPRKLDKNIVLVRKEKALFSLNNIKKILLDVLFGKKKFILFNQEISHFSVLASFVYNDVRKYINKNVKKIITPYEGQPFQNVVFKQAHEVNKKIETVGYIHSFPIGLPTNLFKRPGHPKKLIVNGISQQHSLSKFFGWKKKELRILPSARLKKKLKYSMHNKIFLPIEFDDKRKIIKALQELIISGSYDLSKFEVKNHPACYKSKKHNELIKLINIILNSSVNRNNNQKKFSIFIGPTGSVIEALERDLKVYHICENPLIECYSKKIWKYINCVRIGDNLFEYSKINSRKLLILDNYSNTFKRYVY